MLGSRIAVLRRRSGWSQAELAEKLGISPSAVGMYEQGRREPAAEILVHLSQLFDVSTDYLLTGKTRTSKESEAVEEAFSMALMDADKHLRKRDHCPFTRDELTVLFAAMLLGT